MIKQKEFYMVQSVGKVLFHSSIQFEFGVTVYKEQPSLLFLMLILDTTIHIVQNAKGKFNSL